MNILEDVVEGYQEALKCKNKPKYDVDSIDNIASAVSKIISGSNPSLKDTTKDPDLKRFFKEYTLDEETVDEFGRDSSSRILISDFDPARLRPTNYDLRLGQEVYVTGDTVPRNLGGDENENWVAIEPGEFGILMTHEYIHVPLKYLGMISLRFSYKKEGLVNISGFHVDPGFTGRIIFSVFNTGPRSVVLRYKDPVFMIMFDTLSEPPLTKKGGYSEGFSGQKHIPVDMITSLGGPSVSVIALDRRLRKMESTLRVLETVLVGLFIAAVGYIAVSWIAQAFPWLHLPIP